MLLGTNFNHISRLGINTVCGICGKVVFSNQEQLDSNIIQKMTSFLKHRGPDDSGVYLSGNANDNSKARVGLGHRRLSIIDLSKQAQQPMSNEDQAVWLIFNGEIYNFQDLRIDLEKKGHIFKSKTDSEVIIHLYEDKGVDFVKELRGMFAFAIWDNNKKLLLLARDRVGQKPLYYYSKNGNFVFASEISSLLQDPSIERRVNIESLHCFLTYQYIPAPEAMFLNIKKLPPAHILIWQENKIEIRKYWNLNYNNKIFLGEDEYCERILELLTEATKIRLISDVPLGAFLSGGIDSSAIVAIMSKLSSRPVKTFSIGFKDRTFDELEYAREIAKLFNTEHHEFIVEPNALEILPELIRHFGEPFADSSSIPTYYLSKITRREVTVALNGDGGDESFAGYERYAANKLANIYGLIPKFVRQKMILPLVSKFQESTDKKDFIRNFKKFIEADSLPREERYARWMSTFDNQSKQNLYSQDLNSQLKGMNSWDYLLKLYECSGADDFLDSTLFVDVMSYLPGDLLVKVDIASMANSLEARSPFLDHELMEFAASIPSNLKLKGMATKYILKKALSKILPKKILYRKKSGFGVPVGAWFRGDLKKYAYDILLSDMSIKRNYFKKESIKRILDEHVSGKIDHGHRIWSLLNLELWHNNFIDNKS